MPGRITMDQQGAVGPLDLKKDRSHAQIAQMAPAVQGQNGQQASNAVQAHRPNGTLSNGVAAHDALPRTNGDMKQASTILADPSNPPPLDQSWREMEMFNKSFGKLLTRISHQCFVDLNEALSSMSSIQDNAQRPQINGALQPTLDTSEASLQKKRILMEFANNQRDRFIKALVLADASKNQDEHARMIDLKTWIDRQIFSYIDATNAVALVKLKMIDFKLASPNMEEAMEILSSGKLSKIPHLGYVPPKKASAKELLETLRDMNVIIATRLSLNDELSPHMQEYSIADGRVTFKVPGEFEVDLSVGDDDPVSQFFFLDLRLDFRPSTGAIADTLRSHLESRVNQALMENGLPGCYDFLHNFVLTHKINVLRNQVNELTQGKWFECIRAENLRRSLTVQYWTGRPGAKSWLEIGIDSGKKKVTRSRKSQTSCLSVRWFRAGMEVKDEPLDFDWNDLNLERYLSTVIAKHTSWMLRDIESRIKELAPADSVMSVQTAEAESAPRALSLSLPSLQTPLQLRIDSVTGQYSISPPSGPTARAEGHLNANANSDPAVWLVNTLCAVAQERVHKAAELLQWAPVTRLARQDNLHKIFGPGLRAHSTFVPRKAWGEQWALAVTLSLLGNTWWAVSLEDKRDDQGTVIGRVIAKAQRVRHAAKSARVGPISQTTLLGIERSAVAEVAFGALSSQFSDLRVSHRFEQIPPRQHSNTLDTLGAARSPLVLFFSITNLLKQPTRRQSKTWANSPARLTHHGMVTNDSSEGSGVRHELRVALDSSKMKEMQKHLTNFKDRNLVLNEDGGVALRILAPFGKPFAEQIRARLQSIDLLDRHVCAMHSFGLQCTHASLSRLSFVYQRNPELSATLMFPSSDDGGGKKVLLKLLPSDVNPHCRIRVLLEDGLNRSGDHGVEAIGFILLLTLPLLQAFERIETSSKNPSAVSIRPQTSTTYTLRYSAPLTPCTFEIRSRSRKERGGTGGMTIAYWHIQPKRDGPVLSDAFTQALTQDLWNAKGEHWHGVGNGVVATVAGIGAVVERLDEVVRRFEVKDSAAEGQQQRDENGDAKPAAGGVGGQQEEGKTAVAARENGNAAAAATAAPGTMKKEKETPDVIMLD